MNNCPDTFLFLYLVEMKRLFVFLLFIAATAFRPATGPLLHFDELKYNFGFIRQGEVVTHEFAFLNNGDQPVVISDAEVACKCTTVDFPKEPIAPGAKGTIKVTFDSKSAIDRQERTVLLKSNGPEVTLTFKCVVLKKKE